MKTIVKRVTGQVITAVPINKKCYRCKKKLDIEKDKSFCKFGSVITSPDGYITISWNWFCYNCTDIIQKVLKGRA